MRPVQKILRVAKNYKNPNKYLNSEILNIQFGKANVIRANCIFKNAETKLLGKNYSSDIEKEAVFELAIWHAERANV